MAGELVASKTRFEVVPLKMAEDKQFTPALGSAKLTPFYDLAIAGLTREKTWRGALVRYVDPQAGDRILDVGCGTGSLVTQLKSTTPECQIVGLDPDPEVLGRAQLKAERLNQSVDWREGFLTDELAAELAPMTKVVSSLVFHQTPVAEKKNILGSIWRVLEPGGRLYIADYGHQRTSLMRMLFRWTVQAIDGVEDTTPNAEGELPGYMKEMGFDDVQEQQVIPTATGSISIYLARKPG